jgi:serine/threonine-protein phosphatase PP1 catalytic subunit
MNKNRFDKMPIAAVLSNKIFCVHAGIPGPVKLSEITKEGAYPYVWNDPSNPCHLCSILIED